MRSRDYCTSQQQEITMCLNVIRVSYVRTNGNKNNLIIIKWCFLSVTMYVMNTFTL